MGSKSRKNILYIMLAAVFFAQIAFALTGKVDATIKVTDNEEQEVMEEIMEEEASYAVIARNTLKSSEEMVEEIVVEETQSEYYNMVVAYVEPYLTVYAEQDTNSEVVGKMYPKSEGIIVERGEEWTRISSGNVEGYILNKYVCFDEEAEAMAILLGNELTNAITIEEEEEQKRKEEEARQAALAKAAAIAANTTDGTAVTQGESMELSDEDLYLLACIVDWEAGWESYEGKLAVANVVLNRVRSTAYGNTVSAVIYARGQFGGVLDSSGNLSTKWSTRLANGPRTEDCMRAAVEAASGINNIGGYLFFIGKNYASYDSYRSYEIIGNHCFYQR